MLILILCFQVDGIAAMAGGVDPNMIKKLNDLELENKNLKKGKN